MLNKSIQLTTLFIVLAVPTVLSIQNSVNAQEKEKQVFASAYREYLSRDFPAKFHKLCVGTQEISIVATIASGIRFPADELAIAILPAHVPSQKTIFAQQIQDVPLVKVQDSYSLEIPRFSTTGNDRSHCRFVLVHRNESGGFTALSASTYATEWESGVQRKLVRLVGRDRKGLGGIPGDSARKDHQIYELGLSHVTINIVLDALIRPGPAPGFERWQFEGQSVYLNEKRLVQFDERLERLREKGIVASMILLVGNQRNKNNKAASPLVHPEADADGLFAMPDLATPAGAFLYRAIIFHLAERFTREGDNTGRVTNWIMHNEIDQSRVWTTMGEQTIERYMETYMRSARLVYQVTRQFDPHSRVFVSLTHYWTKIGNARSAFRGRDVIDMFARASKVEGDFEWGVAFHPYPGNLHQPRTWNDKNTNFTFDTPLITPRNLEVLPGYLDQPQIRYLGTLQRAILFSEQGCNSPSMSLEDQKLQAAGIVYMFHRMRLLPTVEAFHYHAYRDSPQVEGGTRLGLVDENETPKFAWDIYRQLNTANEEQAVSFAWPTMGGEARRHANSRQQVIQPRSGDRF